MWASYGLVCTALLCLAGIRPANAQTPEQELERRVLLVIDRPNDPLIERIGAEVAALGLGVLTRPSTGPLEEDARAQHAAAAIRVLPSRKGVEVWMADATTGRTLARQLVVDERPTGPDYGLVALQTAEILRTGLLGRTDGAEKPKEPPPPPPPPPPPDPPPPPAAVRAPASWPHQTSVLAGLGALSSPGGIGTSLAASLSLERTIFWRLGIVLDVTLPIRRGSLSDQGSTAEMGAYLVGLAGFVRLLPPDAHWFLTTGAGGAVVHVRTTGTSRESFLVGASSNGLVGAAYARIDAGWRPRRWARIGLASIVGTAFPRVTVRFAGNPVGTWGRVFVAALAVAGVDWE
jgi:hypothetical protein